MRAFRTAALALAVVLSSGPVQAGQGVSLVLNWTPGADHAPIYYAKSQGWYEKAALLEQASGLDREEQMLQWRRIKELMTDEFTTTKALGWIDGERMKKDYALVETCLGIEKPFAVETAFTTNLLDPTIKMDASRIGP